MLTLPQARPILETRAHPTARNLSGPTLRLRWIETLHRLFIGRVVDPCEALKL